MPYLQLVRVTWHLLSDGGFYVFLGGVVVLLLAFLPAGLRPDLAPATLSAIGLGLMGLGFGMGLLAVWLERNTVQELEAQHAAAGEIDSPYAWVADGVWREWSRFDGYRELWEGPQPVVPLVDQALAHEISLDEFQAAPRIKPDKDAETPPVGDVEQHAARLAGSHGPRTLEGLRWPVCCERLSVLVLAGSDGPVLPTTRERVRFQLIGNPETSVVLHEERATLLTLLDDSPDQPVTLERVVGFHCRNCGRLYADLLPVKLR